MTQVPFSSPIHLTGGRQFLVRWSNIAPGDIGAPFDAAEGRLLSCQSHLRQEGVTRVQLWASNEIGSPQHAVSIAELADKGAASLIMIPMRARWYFPAAMRGTNEGSLDVILLFEKF